MRLTCFLGKPNWICRQIPERKTERVRKEFKMNTVILLRPYGSHAETPVAGCIRKLQRNPSGNSAETIWRLYIEFMDLVDPIPLSFVRQTSFCQILFAELVDPNGSLVLWLLRLKLTFAVSEMIPWNLLLLMVDVLHTSQSTHQLVLVHLVVVLYPIENGIGCCTSAGSPPSGGTPPETLSTTSSMLG